MQSASIDWAHFEELRQYGSQELTRIISLLLVETERRIRDLDEAVVAGHASELAELAHSVKGSTGLFGAVALSNLAEALEKAGQRLDFDDARQLIARLKAELVRTRASFLEALAEPSSG